MQGSWAMPLGCCRTTAGLPVGRTAVELLRGLSGGRGMHAGGPLVQLLRERAEGVRACCAAGSMCSCGAHPSYKDRLSVLMLAVVCTGPGVAVDSALLPTLLASDRHRCSAWLSAWPGAAGAGALLPEFSLSLIDRLWELASAMSSLGAECPCSSSNELGCGREAPCSPVRCRCGGCVEVT